MLLHYSIDFANCDRGMLLGICQESAKVDDPTHTGVIRYHPGDRGYTYRHPSLEA